MEHTPILPPAACSEPIGLAASLAMQGLGELLSVPIPRVARALAGFDRDQLGAAIEVMIALLDASDGDPDAEMAGDTEDDFELSEATIERANRDPSIDCVDQDAGAYFEWHTMRGSQKGGANILAGHEDDEDDDPAEEDDHAGQCDEDGVNTAFHHVRYTVGASGPGCDLSDPGGSDDDNDSGRTPDWGIDQTKPLDDGLTMNSDRLQARGHRDRIRATRCDPARWGEFRLRPA